MSARKFWLFVLALAMWTQSASALQSDAPVWQKVTTDQGCIAFLYDRNDAQFPGWRAYHWTGSCTAGQAINGQGILQEHGLFFEERVVTEYRGTLAQGYFQGEMTRLPYRVNDNGEWDSSNPIAELAFKAPYERGCWVDKQNEYSQKFCEQDRPGLIVAKISKKPLWRDVKGSTATALPLAAASPAKPADVIWTLLQHNGCTLILNHSFDGYTADYSADFSGNKVLSLASSFACGPDGLAQGMVQKVTTWQLAKGKDAGKIIVDTMTATAKDGLLDGNVHTEIAGAVNYAEIPRDYTFSDGCLVNEANCDKAAGQRMRTEFLANRGKVSVGSNTAIAPKPAPPAFSKTETVAFENLGVSITELLKSVGPAGFPNEQAKIEAIVSKLGLSFYSGQEAAFGGDYARMQTVQNAIRALLAGKGASADAGQLVELVLDAVKGSLSSSRQGTGNVSAPETSVYTPKPVVAMPGPVAPTSTAQAAPKAALPPAPANLPFEKRWSVRDVGRGCKMVLRDGDLMWDESGAGINGQFSRIEWSGACGANGLAQGAGALSIFASGIDGEGRNYRSGTVTNGLLEGKFSISDQYYENGSWQISADDGGTRQWTYQYVRGCPFGQYEDPDCGSNIAVNLRDNFLIGRARVAAIPVAKPEAVLVNNPPPLPHFSTVAIAPKLLTNVGALMVYPLEALRNGWEGRTAFSLSITATGGVGQCTITASSGFAILDNETCVMMQRASFSPARDGYGNPVSGTFSSGIRWQLP